MVEVQDRKRAVSLPAIAGRLGGEVAKELGAVVDAPVSVAVEHKPGVIRTGRRPRDLLGGAVRIQIETNPTNQVGERKSVAVEIEEDR